MFETWTPTLSLISWRGRTALLAALAAVVALGIAPSSASAACRGHDLEPGTASVSSLHHATLCLLNRQRRLHHVRALRSDSDLRVAATRHAKDMVQRDYFSHTSPGGVDFVKRILATGYVPAGASWTVGENLAWGSQSLGTPGSIVRSWMKSPGHRANILNRGFNEIGIGIVLGVPAPGAPRGATYATEFGRVSR
jgi:uncharacterized protein YkwD